MLVFYFALPIASIVLGMLGIADADTKISGIFIYGFPVIFLLFYICFMAFLILQMFKYKKLYDMEAKKGILQYESEISL